MGWSAAGLVVVGKSADELREAVTDRFSANGPISGYTPTFGRASFAVGQSSRGVTLWDPIGKLAFGPRGEDMRRELSKGTKLVAFQMSSAEGKYGLRVYEDGEPVRAIDIEGGQSIREVGAVLDVERALPARSNGYGVDEDWVFEVLRGVTGVGFDELSQAPYELFDV